MAPGIPRRLPGRTCEAGPGVAAAGAGVRTGPGVAAAAGVRTGAGVAAAGAGHHGLAWCRRALYPVVLAAATGVLLVAVAVATSTSAGSGTGSATTGSVSLSAGGQASRTCSYGAMMPGDLTGASRCTLAVRYTGSIPAYLSLSVSVRSRAGRGGTPLFDGTNTTGLAFTLTDGHTAFAFPAGLVRRDGDCRAGYVCWSAQHELAAWYGTGGAALLFRSGGTAAFTLTPSFGRDVGNRYQGGSAVVTLIATAVQAPGNSLPSDCTTATIGQPCPGRGSFSWS